MIAALFIIAINWTHAHCPSIIRWINCGFHTMGSSHPVRSQSLWTLPMDDTHFIPLKCWRCSWAGERDKSPLSCLSCLEQVIKGCGYDHYVVYSLGPGRWATTARSHETNFLKKNGMAPIHSVYGIMKNSG